MPVLFLVLIVYFPGCWILKKWLPNYSESLIFLGILLPLIVFSSKNNLLTNNYLKVYRKEKTMLLINLCAVTVGATLFLISAYVFNNLEFILYSLIFTVMLSSVVSELVVMKQIQKRTVMPFIVEFFMTAIFIFAARYCSLWIGLAVYAAALIVYAILYRKPLLALIQTVLKKNKKTQTQEHP